MLSWSPAIQVLRHCNVAKIVIPTGSVLSDFRIEHIQYDTHDIKIQLLHKDHVLRTNTHDVSPQREFSHHEVQRPILLA